MRRLAIAPLLTGCSVVHHDNGMTAWDFADQHIVFTILLALLASWTVVASVDSIASIFKRRRGGEAAAARRSDVK